MAPKRSRKKHSRKKAAPRLSFFEEALISWVNFRNECAKTQQNISVFTECRSSTSLQLESLLQDLQLSVLLLELCELQLDFECDYRYRTPCCPGKQRNKRKHIAELKEINLLEFNRDVKGKRKFVRRQRLKPKVDRSVRKFLFADHDYVNITAAQQEDNDDSDEDAARITKALKEVHQRLNHWAVGTANSGEGDILKVATSTSTRIIKVCTHMLARPTSVWTVLPTKPMLTVGAKLFSGSFFWCLIRLCWACFLLQNAKIVLLGLGQRTSYRQQTAMALHVAAAKHHQLWRLMSSEDFVLISAIISCAYKSLSSKSEEKVCIIRQYAQHASVRVWSSDKLLHAHTGRRSHKSYFTKPLHKIFIFFAILIPFTEKFRQIVFPDLLELILALQKSKVRWWLHLVFSSEVIIPPNFQCVLCEGHQNRRKL